MSRNAFLKTVALEPPPARSRLLSRSCCPPDSGGLFGWLQHLRLTPVVGSTRTAVPGHEGNCFMVQASSNLLPRQRSRFIPSNNRQVFDTTMSQNLEASSSAPYTAIT